MYITIIPKIKEESGGILKKNVEIGANFKKFWSMKKVAVNSPVRIVMAGRKETSTLWCIKSENVKEDANSNYNAPFGTMNPIEGKDLP